MLNRFPTRHFSAPDVILPATLDRLQAYLESVGAVWSTKARSSLSTHFYTAFCLFKKVFFPLLKYAFTKWSQGLVTDICIYVYNVQLFPLAYKRHGKKESRLAKPGGKSYCTRCARILESVRCWYACVLCSCFLSMLQPHFPEKGQPEHRQNKASLIRMPPSGLNSCWDSH